MKASEELYVGYRKRAPAATARFVRIRLAALAALVVGVGGLLASQQGPFDPGSFELGRELAVEGLLLERPYPMIAIESAGGEAAMRLLVLFGKHGAAAAVEGLQGHRVEVRGTPIVRGDRIMLELAEGSLRDLGPGGRVPARVDLGHVALSGEIVDSKCYLGVMKPSREAPHRDCARNCVAGGIPPALWAPSTGGDLLLFLVDRQGAAVGAEVLPWMARPVEVRGDLWSLGDLLLLSVESYRAMEST